MCVATWLQYAHIAYEHTWALEMDNACCWQEIGANAHETCDSISLISYAGCLGLSPVISAKVHSKCASQPKIAKKSLKTPIVGVQGHSRLSMLVSTESLSAVLVMIYSKSVSICNRSHARRANSGEITISWGIPLWCPRSRGISSPSGTKFAPKKLETTLSCGENPESLSHLCLNRYRVVTDRQTDGQAELR